MIDSIRSPAISSSPRSDARVVRRDQLSRLDRSQMFALLAGYFTGVSQTVFERDLGKKEWVIVLRDARGAIDGFSTLMRLAIGGHTIFYSGDTIVAPHRWGTPDLGRVGLRHVVTTAASLPGDAYWFLISSGFRTYRFLPVFFREFVPRFDRPAPSPMKLLLDTVARSKFGDRYDEASGVIRLASPAPLRPGLSDPSRRASHDPHIGFFITANPGHAAGDELACLVRLSEDNLTPAGARMLR